MALAQFKPCDFMIEHIDEVIRQMVKRHPDQQRRLKLEK